MPADSIDAIGWKSQYIADCDNGGNKNVAYSRTGGAAGQATGGPWRVAECSNRGGSQTSQARHL